MRLSEALATCLELRFILSPDLDGFSHTDPPPVFRLG